MSTSYKLFYNIGECKIEYTEYNYSNRTLKDIIKEHFSKQHEQVIFTKNRMLQVLKEIIHSKHYYVQKLNFIESIDPQEFDDLAKLLNSIHEIDKNELEAFFQSVNKEIDWIEDENNTDLKSLTVGKIGDGSLEIFCNGIIYSSNNKIINEFSNVILDPILLEELKG